MRKRKRMEIKRATDEPQRRTNTLLYTLSKDCIYV